METAVFDREWRETGRKLKGCGKQLNGVSQSVRMGFDFPSETGMGEWMEILAIELVGKPTLK